jgi:hypothetical protein
VLASIEMDPEQWKSAACQVAARKLTKVELTKTEWARFPPTTPNAHPPASLTEMPHP